MFLLAIQRNNYLKHCYFIVIDTFEFILIVSERSKHNLKEAEFD